MEGVRENKGRKRERSGETRERESVKKEKKERKKPRRRGRRRIREILQGGDRDLLEFCSCSSSPPWSLR